MKRTRRTGWQRQEGRWIMCQSYMQVGVCIAYIILPYQGSNQDDIGKEKEKEESPKGKGRELAR